MGSSLAGETAAINNRIIIKSRAKGARDRSFGKGALFPTNGNESGNVQGPRTIRCKLREKERKRDTILSAILSKPFGKSRTNSVDRGTNDSTSPTTASNWILAAFPATCIVLVEDLGRSRSPVPHHSSRETWKLLFRSFHARVNRRDLFPFFLHRFVSFSWYHTT